ncbi:hypothetical protein [Promicromonospora sp. NPDC057488]|uniref:hypothetical protein n=1 Tax=Promicromonospora sp. NPDC057488 TaxID=3346147 RepID=UPI00366F8CC1
MNKRHDFGGGYVILGDDGAPEAFGNDIDADRRYLLDSASEPWHGPEHAWGSGFVVTSAGSGRWQAPSSVRREADGVVVTHRPLPALRLDVERRVTSDHYTETYTWTNAGDAPLQVTSLALNVPVRDLYDDAAGALARSCHAHLFTGGSWAWVLAEPMSGTPPLLGTVVTEGALWAYSVESRNKDISSNSRGHLLVHPTDHARNPGAFGGQPVIDLGPGEGYTLAWRTGWYDSRDEFLAATAAPASIPALTAGGALPTIDVAPGARVIESPDVVGERGVGHGVRHIELERDGRRSRTAVAALSPVRELVEARVRRILDEHRPTERAGTGRFALVPVDTRTGLRQTRNAWSDWADGAERIGMAVLLQQARLRGWGDRDELDEALAGYATFVREHLVRSDGSVRRGSGHDDGTLRLYNTPWVAHFFATQHALYEAHADLEQAARLLEASYELGVADHLSIGHPEVIVAVASALDGVGESDRADALRKALVEHAHGFARRGAGLPSHEVAYEQSMVAPLVSLLATAYELAPDPVLLTALRTSLRWLRAFGGPQPHVRLRDIGIRHWDGYWFGLDRQWGDTFPHYWSVLSAIALRQLPAALRDDENQAAAAAIFAANLVDFTPDGGATSAFIMPSCVDGRPAHGPDPLANDQDWALALLLRTEGAL